VDGIENDDYSSQLRSLRLILGKNFRPISTAKLASVTNIPPVSIRGVEAGRRQLNNEDRRNIQVFLGANWNHEFHRWSPTWDSEIAYTRAEYEAYQSQLLTREFSQKYQADFLQALDLVLGALEPKEANIALLKLFHELRRIAAQNDLVVAQFLAPGGKTETFYWTLPESKPDREKKKKKAPAN
jgi:hypothetical protein